MSRLQRIELAIFIACFFAFAYFNQGGGWNQNARFAEVRAMVEEGRFAIDNFLIYRLDDASGDLVRIPVEDGEYTADGKRFRLSWVDMEWNLYPVHEKPMAPGTEKSPMVEITASGDISYVPTTGHFHPNKPPGTSFFGVPGYFVINRIERMLGINPDHWWTMNLNGWLTTVCSVGLLSAIGCVVFFRMARDLAGGAALPAVLATIAFAFGTTFFPFGTIFFDHNLTATLQLTAFYLLWLTRDSAPVQRTRAKRDRLQFFAGLLAGLGAITNYIAAAVVIILGFYLLLATLPGKTKNWRGAIAYSLGVVPPFLLICWYGWTCFGSPFALNTDFQNPLFKDPNGALGMFALPNGYIAGLLLFSPYRGIFFLAPVLIMGVLGALIWLREKQYVAEARLCLGVFAFFFLVNASFNGYHSGFSAGPRYLVPGIPFLALPLVMAFARWRGITAVLAVVSIGVHLLLTATDGQNPVGVGGHARVEGRRSEWSYNLVGDYAWPLFVYHRAWPLLDQQMVVHMEKEGDRIAAQSEDPEEVARETGALQSELRASIARGDSSPFLLGSIEGPVSVNPIGIFEGLFTYSYFPPGSEQSRWASFNVGELLPPHSFWPRSRSSLLPLLLISGGLCAWAIRLASRGNAPVPTTSSKPEDPVQPVAA
jgi:hypothetical protein